MPSEVEIKIKASDETKEGFESAIDTAWYGANKIENAVKSVDVTGVVDKVGHTGEVAAKMAVNIAQAFGLQGKEAEKFIELFRQIDDGFDAVGKAAHLVSVANAGLAASNTAVATTATGAATATTGMTTALLANPITLTLVAIAAAATAVYVAFQKWPEAEDDVESLNKKLKEQRSIIEEIIDAANRRVKQDTFSEELAARQKQKEVMEEISKMQGNPRVEGEMRATAQRVEQLEKEKQAYEDKLRTLAETIALSQKELENNSNNLDAVSKIAQAEAEINIMVSNRTNLERQIADLRAQAEALQDRAMKLPEERHKEELKRIEEKAKAEEKAAKEKERSDEAEAKRREKLAADRLRAEDEYASAVDAMYEDRKEAEEKAKKDKEKADKESDKDGPAFVGLEELGKNIQLAALKTTSEAADRAAAIALSKEQAAKAADLIELTKRSIAVSESVALSSAKTAETIEKVGTLA